MINKEKFEKLLACYKEDFPNNWPNEGHKWEAIKRFQDNWDINAEDFAGMFEKACSKTESLLLSVHFYPLGMILEFVKASPEETRAMFVDLFDESKDVFERISNFKAAAEAMRVKYGPADGAWKQHFQNENAISTYLWLRYPDKYYIYKFSEAKNCNSELDAEYSIKQGDYVNNIKNASKLYDEIIELAKADGEVVEMLRSSITDEHYPDPELKTLAIDIAFYASKYFPNRKAKEYWPAESEYTPGLTAEQWAEYLEKVEMPKHEAPMQMLKAILDCGGEATASELSAKYGGNPSRYIGCTVNLGRRVKEYFDLKSCMDGEKERYFPIPFLGRKVDGDGPGLYSYKLRDELKEALKSMDLLNIPLHVSEDVPEYAWYVGATGDEDYSETYIREGRWENGWDDKFNDLVNSVKVGDRIALKASYTRKLDLPFNNFGKTVSVMAIKAIGIVTENPCDGKNLKVDWEEVNPYREWYGQGVMLQTIHLVKASEGTIKKSLLAFTFAGEDQDYSICEDHYRDDEEMPPEANSEGPNYWWLNASPAIWSFDSKNVGEVMAYTLYNANGNKRRIFKNFLAAKPGDIILGYESAPVKKVVARAKVVSRDDKELYFEKIESFVESVDYKTLKSCPELENMEFLVNPNGSLFKLTEEEYSFIMDMIRELNPIDPQEAKEAYDKSKFLSEVYMSEDSYDTIKTVLLNKKNLILQGAPGVGKTFAAKRLAYSIMGEMDEKRVEFVQFHQNYSYEDFVMGYKPDGEGFKLQEGIFYKFCKRAANHPKEPHFFIIDEINRGNMSKIFGELLMLIEKDYRGTDITLAYDGRSFSVPKNLYIIGMMNTADRSLAMIDYALRRRFGFYEMEPGFDSKGFAEYQQKLADDTFDEIVSCIKRLNEEIRIDRSLGKGFRIGHSYLCNIEEPSEEILKSIVEFDIIPMLEEYWFDDESKLQVWENNLRGIFG